MPAPRVALCTIATRNHLALARTLLESAQITMPDAARYLLLVDVDAQGAIQGLPVAELPPGHILHPSQVMEQAEFAGLLARYCAAEVCFALKPALLQHLLGQGYQQVHYLDSDIWLLGALDGPTKQLEGNAVLLTPHLLQPRGSDTYRSSEMAILRAGTFNAGYLAVTPQARSLGFLDWWRARVMLWGYNMPRLGMCGDQRWLDPVPYLFDKVVVCRDPGINVGYWRLPLAQVERNAGQVLLGGRPLIMLHLSGFDPRRPDSFSRYAGESAACTGIVSELLHQYCERLLAHGWEAEQRHRYRHYRWWQSSSLAVRLLRAGALALRLRFERPGASGNRR